MNEPQDKSSPPAAGLPEEEKVQVRGSESSESEIRKAYNSVIDTGVSHFWDRRAIPGVNADEVVTLYKLSLDAYHHGNHLAAERWARTAKHLSRAFWHEAKIAFLEPRVADLPYLGRARAHELDLTETEATTTDLLNSASHHIPLESSEISERMRRYLSRAQRHLKAIELLPNQNDLLRVERIQGAFEYGRVLECIALACEAEASAKSAA